MPQPILPTIHSHNHDSEGASSISKDNISSKQQPYVASFEEDPVWMKCKSVIFHGAGRVQSKLGRITGVDAFSNRGQAWVSWAAHASDQADFLSDQGAPSRFYGEYNRWVGYFEHFLGANSETHYNDSQMIDEIDYSRNRSSA